MKLDARMTRRSAVALAASLLLAGCASGAPAGSAPTGSAPVSAWTAVLDAEAPILNVEGEEGAAMPGECWTALEDGTIQVQIAGSSIPEPEVESVEFSDGTLTLVMAVPGEDAPATMDFALHQFMVKGGDAASVARVEVVRGEDASELPAGVVVADVASAE